jgi:hypothetical protein
MAQRMVDFPVPLGPTTMLRLHDGKIGVRKNLKTSYGGEKRLLLEYSPWSWRELDIIVRQEIVQLDSSNRSMFVVSHKLEPVFNFL